MNMRKIRLTFSLQLIFLLLTFLRLTAAHSADTGFNGAWGKRYRARPEIGKAPKRHPHQADNPESWVRHWNEIAINASGLDHTPVAPGENRVFGEQFGPARSSRAMAIVHIAIFDALNAIAGGYQSYTGVIAVLGETSMQAAIAQAAHDTLAALFPSQATSFAAQLAADLSAIPNGRPKANGVDLGRRAATAILTMRANDGSQHTEPRVGIEFIYK